MNVRLSLPAARPAVPSLAAIPVPSLAPAALNAHSLLAPSVMASAAPASPLALNALKAAQSAPDAAPAALFASGRATFDVQAARPASDAVAGGFSVPAALEAPSAGSFHAALAVPAALPLAAASSDTTLLLGLGVAALFYLAFKALPFNRERPPLPRPPMPAAGSSLPELQQQARALIASLYASCRGERDSFKAAAALEASWARTSSQGGLAVWHPQPGEWEQTPIHGSLFGAIALPDTLRLIARRAADRHADTLSDLLRGLSAEVDRASSPADLLARLGWWNRHFSEFDR
jgi:hypothetical protein